jgi:hypothetical protein
VGLRNLWRTFVSSPLSLARGEDWVRKHVEKGGGSFTCRVSMFETSWNPAAPDIVGANSRPFSGPALITYTETPDGSIHSHVEHEGASK